MRSTMFTLVNVARTEAFRQMMLGCYRLQWGKNTYVAFQSQYIRIIPIRITQRYLSAYHTRLYRKYTENIVLLATFLLILEIVKCTKVVHFMVKPVSAIYPLSYVFLSIFKQRVKYTIYVLQFMCWMQYNNISIMINLCTTLLQWRKCFQWLHENGAIGVCYFTKFILHRKRLITCMQANHLV